MPEQPLPGSEREFDRLKYELERDKFSFEKVKEENRIDVERRRLAQARTDTFVKGVLGVAIPVLATVALSLYGRYYEQQRADQSRLNRKAELEISEKNRKAEMTIQLINAREKANNDLRASMFNTVMEFYAKRPDQMSSVLLLELVGLNFQDTVLLKPVFEKLDSDPNLDAAKKEALRKASRNIVKKQLETVRHARDGSVCKLALKVDETKSPPCFMDLSLTLLGSKDNEIELRTNIFDGYLAEGQNTEDGDKFKVNYFDMPMIDYSVAHIGGSTELWRYSIVLDEASVMGATVAIAVLPQETYSAQMPFRFDEMIHDYLTPYESIPTD